MACTRNEYIEVFRLKLLQASYKDYCNQTKNHDSENFRELIQYDPLSDEQDQDGIGLCLMVLHGVEPKNPIHKVFS